MGVWARRGGRSWRILVWWKLKYRGWRTRDLPKPPGSSGKSRRRSSCRFPVNATAARKELWNATALSCFFCSIYTILQLQKEPGTRAIARLKIPYMRARAGRSALSTDVQRSHLEGSQIAVAATAAQQSQPLAVTTHSALTASYRRTRHAPARALAHA